ncbi:hypothetical protein FSP39_016249 [Pinctada imbricata]|uniref:Reverse transcriptase domain-containing protein n=1 Tax=Pinctada imbricata TaxID=66713 RepID=A0AA88YAQ0_PINIB|nr:hypothetical protein FSP39_016249 [Pinctada imbricata]
MFLCHINDLPDCVSLSVRLFADDCLLYRTIRNTQDHETLQKDLNNLENWANKWGMKFNAKKCYILSINKKTSKFYQLNQHVLQEVQDNPYLGLQISNDLKWNTHINNVCKKASSTLGFIRRNLRNVPQNCRKTAYISLVRSIMEYGATIWNPYLKGDIDKLEKIQNRAIRFIKKDYKSRESGCITKMREELELETLEARRLNLRLILMYKIVEGLVPALPTDKFEEEEDDKAGSMAYKILSAEQSKELLGMQILEMQSKLSEIFSLGNYSTDLQHAATLDYYTAAVWWGKQQNFTEAQLSGFFTVIYTLFDNIKEKHMHLVDNLKEYQILLKGIEPEHPDVKSEGLDFFNVVQAKAVSDYIFQSVFQHYRLYEFMFSHTQAEEIIGTDLEIEVAKPASMPFPPPLDEGAEEELFNTYIATPPPTPAPEEGDGKDTKDEGPEIQDIDAFAELTPQDVQEVIESVTKELLSGLQMDIAAKLREKENNLIQRINKVHKVVEQT